MLCRGMIGIYAVTNTVTRQMYIGRAVKMEQRLNQHFNALRCQSHTNSHLQNSFNKYGKSVFAFEIMIVCRREDCPFYERLLVAGFKTYDREFGFNLTTPCLNVMMHTPEARAAIGAFQKVYQLTNHYLMTDEIAEKIASKLRGRPTGRKGVKFPPGKRGGAPVGSANHTTPHTAEARAKISAGLKAAYAARPQLAAAQSERRTGVKQTAEHIAKRFAKRSG